LREIKSRQAKQTAGRGLLAAALDKGPMTAACWDAGLTSWEQNPERLPSG
jgi:hypothetical protein